MLDKIKKYIDKKLKEYNKDKDGKGGKKFGLEEFLNIFMIILIVDMSIYSIRSYAVKQAEKKTNAYQLEHNATEIDYFTTSINKEVDSAEIVYFIKDEKDNIKVVIKDKNNTSKLIKNIPALSISMNLEKDLISKNINYQWFKTKEVHIQPIIMTFIMKHFILLLIFAYLIYMLKESGALGNKDKFDTYKPKDVKGSLKDIIGYEDIKEEIMHFQQMFKYKKKYKGYGIEDSYNLMFSGPAGTGKTKIATLLAKELDLPIIVASGNLETGYVGGGAKVIKSLYKEAEKQAVSNKFNACIVFIDEGQNLLKKRGQYKEKWADDTSNELLAHLDGIKTNAGSQIITIIASNFDESNIDLDEAMSRRFKKKIHFRVPNLDERIDLINHFLKKVTKKEKNINVDDFAKTLSGITPAIIETIIQEAGLIAINNKEKVNEKNLMKAFETVLVGKSDRKTTKGKDIDRGIISTHEIGHFIVNYINTMKDNNNDFDKTKEDMRVIKISSESISRANALGFVLSENSDSLLTSLKAFEDEIKVLYGGVAAEEVIYGKYNITAGSANDIEKVTNLLKHMIQKCSMYSSAKLNLLDLNKVSEDKSVQEIMDKSEALYNDSLNIVEDNKDLILYLSSILIEKWVLSKEDIFLEIKKFNERVI